MRHIAGVIACAAFCPVIALAQTTFATITGNITDPTGAAVAGTQVHATETGSGYSYDTQSTSDGVYTLANLREGTYSLTVTAPGFQELKTDNIHVVSREIRRLDLSMQVGAVSSTVTVAASTVTPIETETARISQSRGTMDMEELPLNTRSVTSFLALVPGVGAATTVTATYRFNGSRRNQSDFTLDGISNIAYNGTTIGPLTNYLESFNEVRIDSADNTADAPTIGQVTVVSKAGSNDWHGSAFDYYVTPAFRARNFFSPTRATGISHQPGGTIGGPVIIPRFYNGHDKTFFFFDYELSRGSQAQNLINPTVPLAAWRTGNFSGLLPGTVIRNPITGVAYPGNQIPMNELNPVSLAIQNLYYPLPNTGSTTTLTSPNYVTTLTHPFDPNYYWMARIDHRVSDNTFFFARYTWQRQYGSDYDANLPTIGRIHDVRNTRNAVASWSQIFTPSLVNELRYGMSYTNEPRWGANNGPATVAQLGLRGLLPNLPNLPGLPTISFSGPGLTTIQQTAYGGPDFYNFNQFIQDQLTWTHGKHTLKAGTQIARYYANNVVASSSLFGNMQFSNRYTGFAYADFLLGYPSTASIAAPPLDVPFLRWAEDFFVTDEFKVTPKLTADIGLRYEIHPAWQSTNGLASAFDIATGKIVIQDGSQNTISPFFPASYVGVETASQSGWRPGSLIYTDKN
ncbi:MAG: carboxypeptidase regulatory-like domain-containing protein, partial [Acidobacteriaceae bacterium]|nr:carboxypeptidase regulatory-like domain-containing protein [Acidobacteriaceae bacterium]